MTVIGRRELTPSVVEVLFEDSSLLLAVFDTELRYVRISRRLAEINGRPPEDHVGRPVDEVIPELAPELRRHAERALHGETVGWDAVRTTPDSPDEPQRLMATLHPVAADGEVVAVLAIVAYADVPESQRRRAELFGREHAARTRAEAGEQRARFLAEAGTLLDSSLDLRTTLRTLSRIVVPRLADLCLIDMADESGRIRRYAVAHGDPAKESLVWDLTRRWPSGEEIDVGIRQVLRTGETEMIPDVTEAVLERAFPDAEHRARVRELGLRSALVVPLRARSRTLGAMTFAMTDSGRPFGATEIALAEELCGRAALAVDNARLYTELRRADRAQRFLSEATKTLAGSLDVETTLRTVAQLAVDGIVDLCSVDILDAGQMRQVALAHVNPRKLRLVDELRRRWPVDSDTGDLGRALAGGESLLRPDIGERDYEQFARDAEHLELLKAAGVRSAMFIPMVARGRVLGVVSMAVTESDRRLGPEDLALGEELARRGAVATDNARLYTDRTRVARTLQRSLLPARLPGIPALDLAVRFRSAGEATEVGGDFYDVFPARDGTWAAIVGDVCGKGAEAAALTALARHTVRAATRYEAGPVGVLEALHDAIAEQARTPMFCTAALAWLGPGERTTVRVALGGHPPPLVVHADGHVEALAPPGSLLGVLDRPHLGEATASLGPGDLLVLYTDGVTEAGAPRAALGEAALQELLGELAGAGADEVAARIDRRVLEVSDGKPRDDVAVLVIRRRP